MSSNGSTGSSRLSQFGLYRTIDARTEEFLKLSRQRQVRQGCACAAVSTAVTVTVVVSILFLYGYGVSSSASADLRTPSWFDLMNDSIDTTPFDDKLQNSIKFDRASMNLLPVFFDKILEEQESSSQKYETPTEMNFKRSVFPGSSNPFLAQAKIPTPGLYSIQYKTYPVLYIQSPRNTEYYMKVRKTREYERIMSYIDKMINEKVGFGTRSMRNLQYPMTTEKNTENPWTLPIVVRKTARVITKPKGSKSTKIILRSNKTSKQLTMSNAKFNHTTIHEKKNCKCRNHIGTLLDKILQCFQELVKRYSEAPCNKKTEIKNKNTEIPTSNTVTTTISVKPITTTTTTSTSTTTTKPITTTATTPNVQTDINTSSDFPTEIFHFSNSLQKQADLNNVNTKPKELLSQLSPFYVMTGNSNSKNNIPKSNIPAPIKPKSSLNIFLNNNPKNKLTNFEYNNAHNISLSKPDKNVEKNVITVSTSTFSPEKSEEIYQNLLFPETKDREYTKLPQKAIKKYSTNYILRSRSRERIPPAIKPQTTTLPPTTSTSYSLIQNQIDKRKKVSIGNLIAKMNTSPYASAVPINNRPFSGITPEDYIMERIRHGSKKQTTNTIKVPEPVTLYGNNHEKSSNISVFDKIKNLLKTKLMQPRRKSPYSTAQIMKSKTEPKYIDQTNSSQKFNFSTEYVTKNYLESLPIHTTTYNRITTSTTHTPTVKEYSTSPTPLKKYPQDPYLPEITTIKQLNYYRPFPKLGRRNIPYNSREDIWGEDDVYKTGLYDIPHTDFKITSAAPKNISEPTTTTEHVIETKNSSTGSKELQRASVDFSLKKMTSIHNNEKNVWESSQTDDNYTPYKYMIPVGRKSYLEISRGDWKQKEPHADDTNVVYDAFDEMDGL